MSSFGVDTILLILSQGIFSCIYIHPPTPCICKLLIMNDLTWGRFRFEPTPYLHPDCEVAVVMMTADIRTAGARTAGIRTAGIRTAVQDVQDAKPLLGRFLDTLKSLIINDL